MRAQRIENTFFYVLLALTTLAFLWLIRLYLEPLFWATVLAVIFQPVQRRWLHVTGGRASLSAALTLLTITVLVLLPLLFVGISLTHETLSLYDRISSGQLDPVGMLQRIPVPDSLLAQLNLTRDDVIQRIVGYAGTATQFIGARLLAFGQDVLRFLLALGILFYVAFFFFRDGAKLTEKIVRMMPIGDERERELLTNFANVARATIKGTLVVGIVQGTIGGVLFWIAGITAPIFWGSLMTVFSIIPAVGTIIVWLPAGLIMLFTGHVWQGVVILVGGAVVISLVDNILRPILVGKDTKLPDALVLLTTLGGLAVFGISGIVAGPIIGAFFVAVWQMFEDEYAREAGAK